MQQNQRDSNMKWKVNRMETMHFVVESIDGDYANLRRIDDESGNIRVVARALLPFDINEGTKLKWEMLQYEIVE